MLNQLVGCPMSLAGRPSHSSVYISCPNRTVKDRCLRFFALPFVRTLDALRCDLIPSWAKDEKIAYKTFNARVETVDTAPSYRQAFSKRRCLIPADGFYEWRKVRSTVV